MLGKYYIQLIIRLLTRGAIFVLCVMNREILAFFLMGPLEDCSIFEMVELRSLIVLTIIKPS